MSVSAYFGFPEDVIHGLHDAIEIAQATGASVANAVYEYCNQVMKQDDELGWDLMCKMDKILQPVMGA